MRTVAWEIAPQIPLKNCSEEVGGKAIYVILVKEEYLQSSIFFFQKDFASYEEQSSPRGIFVLSRCEEIQ